MPRFDVWKHCLIQSSYLTRRREVRYLLVGCWNTCFAYMFLVVLYEKFHETFHTILIASFATVLLIAKSFFMHKFFVFKSKEHWLGELYRSYVVYGFTSFLSVIGLWVLVDFLMISIYVANALVIASTTCLSYLGHLKFTFRL